MERCETFSGLHHISSKPYY